MYARSISFYFVFDDPIYYYYYYYIIKKQFVYFLFVSSLLELQVYCRKILSLPIIFTLVFCIVHLFCSYHGHFCLYLTDNSVVKSLGRVE